MFTRIMPALKVSDLSISVNWYIQMLGFEVAWETPETCMMESGDLALLLSTGKHLGEKPTLSGVLFFEMDGVRDLYERIGDVVEIAWPLKTTLEFGIRDPDGYTLAFSQEAG